MGHWCGKHQTAFFKTKNMKGYAHPIKGTEPTEWCNESEEGGGKPPELPPTTPTVLPEHQEVIDQSLREVQPPNPQAVGMMTKEIGDMMRAGKLVDIYGPKIAIELMKWYRSQALGITRINYDGKDLPTFEKKGE